MHGADTRRDYRVHAFVETLDFARDAAAVLELDRRRRQRASGEAEQCGSEAGFDRHFHRRNPLRIGSTCILLLEKRKGVRFISIVDDTKIYATLFVLPSFETPLSKLPLPVALRMRSTSTCPPTDGHSYVCAIDCQLQHPGAFAIVRGRLDLQSSVA